MKPPSPEEREILADFSAPRGVWVAFATVVLVAVAVEVPLIVLVATESLLRIQTFNGFAVIAGGLAWGAIMIFVFLWAMKRMNVRGLVAQLRMERDCARTSDNANRLIDEVRAKYVTGGLAERIVDDLTAIREAVVRESIKPKKREIQTGPGGVPSCAPLHGAPSTGASVPTQDGA